MNEPLHLLCYSFDQDAFHNKTLQETLLSNMGSMLSPEGYASHVPIAASHDEQLIQKLGGDILNTWKKRKKRRDKPTTEEMMNILKILNEHTESLILFDMQALVNKHM